ncbi:MAG: hypothetical protein J6T08_09005 [Lentisphaeria bacterium]|nr:hypothetical protein [Lentisphaeria bacterium]
MAIKTEITIRTNTVTGYNYDQDGNPFKSGTPSVSVKSQFRLFWYLYSETPNAGNSNVNIAEWVPEDYSGCGAIVTCDNDYKHREKGELTEVIYSGSDPDVIENVRIKPETADVVFPQTGTLHLEHNNTITRMWRKIPYEGYAANKSTGVYTFYLNFDTSASDLPSFFRTGSVCYVDQEPFFQAVFDPQSSDQTNGLFVFDVTAYSEKLEKAVENIGGRNLISNGIELLPYIVDENNVYNELPSYLCETFALTVNMGSAGNTPEITTPLENQIAAMVAVQTANLLEMIKAKQIYQYSADQTDWHDTFQTGDKYMREKKDVADAQWSDPYPISPPTVFTTAVTHDFDTYDGDDAAIIFTSSELGIADDAQPQVTLWHYEDDNSLKRVADTTYHAVWINDGTLKIEYYQTWIDGRWQLKLS